MADPTVVDVFKFVAVRPAQRAAGQDAGTAFLRDARAETPEGQRHLVETGRAIGSRDGALRRWDNLDLSRLEEVAGVLPRLRERYGAMSPTDEPPEVDTLLNELGLRMDPAERKTLTNAAWDAFYTASATGPDAGSRLETPLSALRVLQLAALDAKPVPQAALAALAVKPVIPPFILDFSQPPRERPDAGASPETGGRPEAPSDETRVLVALLDELSAANEMLDAARHAPALVQPELHGAPVKRGESAPQIARAGVRNLTLSTIPRMKDALPVRPSPLQNNILSTLSLSTDTAVPVATQALQQRVDTLTMQALSMRSNPVFHQLMQDHANKHAGLSVLGDLLGTIVLPPFLLPDIGSAPDVDMTGRIRPLGVGDLKVVKQKLLAYVPGEVAHIENVLKGEHKERKFRVLDRLETTVFESQETVETTERDTQSTDRFELKKEAESTIREDMSVQAGLTVSGSYGPVTMSAHGDFAYATSKEESAKSSANFARDVVDRSVSKIQKTVRNERTTKTLRETEETDTHGFDNKDGDGHVVGIYRWVDKKYRAQVYNYGRRLMLEFVVPEPAAFFSATQLAQGKPKVDAVEPAPFQDAAGQPLTAKSFTSSSYRIFASRYHAAGISPPPQEWRYASASFEQSGIENGKTISKTVKDLVCPDGYRMYYYTAQITALWDNYPHFSLQIGDARHYVLRNTGALEGQDFEVGTPGGGSGAEPEGIVPVSIVGYDVNAYAVNVSGLCSYTTVTYQKWQQDAFDKTYTAYKAMKTEYDQKVRESMAQDMGVQIAGRNPGINRDIIQRELKKHCLTMLTGMHFKDFDAMTDPADQPRHIPEIRPLEAQKEGRFIQFFEQAFEWEHMTYLFYPYFWARKSRWIELFNQSDPDPAFLQFLQSGAARIVVPVSRAYNDAMLYFISTKNAAVADKIWQGGEPPTIDDPLYISIAEELRAQTDDLEGAKPEDEPWEFTLPTTLVWLQPDGALPVFP